MTASSVLPQEQTAGGTYNINQWGCSTRRLVGCAKRGQFQSITITHVHFVCSKGEVPTCYSYQLWIPLAITVLPFNAHPLAN